MRSSINCNLCIHRKIVGGVEMQWFQAHPWVIPAIIGGIGIIYMVFNVGAIIESKKLQAKGVDRHISGIPFLGGIHVLIAGLISPCKWLALFCIFDYTFWSFLYAVFVCDAFKKDKSTQEKNSESNNQ